MAYAGIVFSGGFILGTIRVLEVAPRVGDRAAELAELPAMLSISYCVARWIVRRFLIQPDPATRLRVGIVALLLMLALEFGLALTLRGVTAAQYLSTRDPVSGTAYYLSLVVFALFPLLIRRTSGSS